MNKLNNGYRRNALEKAAAEFCLELLAAPMKLGEDAFAKVAAQIESTRTKLHKNGALQESDPPNMSSFINIIYRAAKSPKSVVAELPKQLNWFSLCRIANISGAIATYPEHQDLFFESYSQKFLIPVNLNVLRIAFVMEALKDEVGKAPKQHVLHQAIFGSWLRDCRPDRFDALLDQLTEKQIFYIKLAETLGEYTSPSGILNSDLVERVQAVANAFSKERQNLRLGDVLIDVGLAAEDLVLKSQDPKRLDLQPSSISLRHILSLQMLSLCEAAIKSQTPLNVECLIQPFYSTKELTLPNAISWQQRCSLEVMQAAFPKYLGVSPHIALHYINISAEENPDLAHAFCVGLELKELKFPIAKRSLHHLEGLFSDRPLLPALYALFKLSSEGCIQAVQEPFSKCAAPDDVIFIGIHQGTKIFISPKTHETIMDLMKGERTAIRVLDSVVTRLRI